MAKDNKKRSPVVKPKASTSGLEVEKLNAEIGRLKKELKKRKKYGLVWEEKPEELVEMCKEKLPVLKEVKNKEIITDKDKPVNLLIEGDNYHALSVLNYTHAKKVDVIYIDPPYNTGKKKEWKFNDKWVDQDDTYRHSKWLASMEKRLKLAKNLLKSTGVIFVSIDDNEAAQLKLLMDNPDLFGEKNFVSLITIYSNPRGRQSTSNIAPTHEYLLLYLKTELGKITGEPLSEERKKEYKYRDKKGYYREIGLRLRGGRATAEQSPTLYFPIYVNSKSAAISLENKSGYIKIIPKFENGTLGTWRWSKKKIIEDIDKLIARPVNGKQGKRWDIFEKDYLSEEKSLKVKSVWFDKEINYDNGADEIKMLFGRKVFDYPKPVALIDKILKISTDKESLILDFFAGSGTTAHAVLNLNRKDGGSRQFILCTNNENNICTDVCYPRVKKVIEGYKNLKGQKVEGLGGNLKYFKTDFVNYDEPTDKNKIKLTEQATEMLCIREGTFEKVVDNERFKIFKNSSHYTGIIWDQAAIPTFKKAIKDIKGTPPHQKFGGGDRFSVYVFSLGDETFDDEFKDLKQKVQLSPIPEAILRVYRRIFK